MFRSQHISSSVVHIKSTVDIQLISENTERSYVKEVI